MNQKTIDRYLQKSGDERIINCNLIENEHGFATWSLSPDALILYNVYGDGPYWHKFFTDLAKQHARVKIRFASRRHPRVWKKYGYTVVGYVLEREV